MKLEEAPDDEMLNIPLPTVGRRAPSLMLWTRLGLLRSSHFLTTVEALRITERMEMTYYQMINGKQLEEPKPLTLNGRKVWTLKQASRMLNRPTKQIQKALYGWRFTRGTDFFVTDQRQLEELSAENGQWFAKKLTLILESGLAKLRMMYVEGVKAPAEEMLKELRSKVEAVMKAALDVNVFLSERSLVEA